MDVGDVTVGSRQLAGLSVHGVVEVGESRGFVVLNVEPADDGTAGDLKLGTGADVCSTDTPDAISNDEGLDGTGARSCTAHLDRCVGRKATSPTWPRATTKACKIKIQLKT